MGAVFAPRKVPLGLPLAVMLLSAALLVSDWLDGYLLGLIHGLVAAAVVGVAASWVLAPKDEKGTADLLRSARREHQVWAGSTTSSCRVAMSTTWSSPARAAWSRSTPAGAPRS